MYACCLRAVDCPWSDCCDKGSLLDDHVIEELVKRPLQSGRVVKNRMKPPPGLSARGRAASRVARAPRRWRRDAATRVEENPSSARGSRSPTCRRSRPARSRVCGQVGVSLPEQLDDLAVLLDHDVPCVFGCCAMRNAGEPRPSPTSRNLEPYSHSRCPLPHHQLSLPALHGLVIIDQKRHFAVLHPPGGSPALCSSTVSWSVRSSINDDNLTRQSPPARPGGGLRWSEPVIRPRTGSIRGRALAPSGGPPRWRRPVRRRSASEERAGVDAQHRSARRPAPSSYVDSSE